jgi:hypothetical protein
MAMKKIMIWPIWLVILAGCSSIRGPDMVNVRAEVGRYIPQALHEDYDDGRWATFDAVEFRIISPAEWTGTNLVVYCTPGSTNAIFRKPGAMCSFTIRREYVAGKSTDTKTGRTIIHSPFDGALENLKEIRMQLPADRVTVPDEANIYIPRDLDDCFAQLKNILNPDDIRKMKAGTEAEMIEYHFGLGTWMRNNWGLWGGSRLAKWFNTQGIKHPDDMSGIILDSFWRHLNGKPVELDRQIKRYKDY